MSSLAKTDLLGEGAAQKVAEYMADTAEGQTRRPIHERFSAADLADIERRVLASMTPKEIAAGYARRGYRRVSRKHRLIARIDRPDWLYVLAADLGKSVAELYRVVTARNAVGYAITNEVSDAWADYYRRVLSKDVVEVPEEVMFLVPTSDHDPVAYVDKAALFAEAYGAAAAPAPAVPDGAVRRHLDPKNASLLRPCGKQEEPR